MLKKGIENMKAGINMKKNSSIDLLYMTPNLVNARDLADILKSSNTLEVDLWEEMNVLEVTLPNKNPVDFEPIDVNFKDPSDAAFVRNRNIKTIYAIQLKEEDLPLMIPYFETLIQHYTGFICGDTPDFKPIYAGTSDR